MTSENGTADTRRSPRHARIEQALRDDFGRLFGLPPEQVLPEATFTALGADSLFLLRASRTVQDRFGVRVPFRRLLSETNTVRHLAELLDGELPADDAPPARPVPVPAAPAPAAPLVETDGAALAGAAPPGGSAVERVLAQQLQLMSLQLESLRGAPAPSPVPIPAAVPAPGPATVPADDERGETEEDGAEIALDAVQQAHVDALERRMADRTAGSRRAGGADRVRLANPAGPSFRLPWKALCHPLQVRRGVAGRVWDVDGNQYVDLSLGGGALLFGHTPPFMDEVFGEALAGGLLAGERTPLAGEVADLVREATGAERVCFVDSRTEAVMAALRLARAVTERTRVAVLAGADHGSFDGVLARRLALGGSVSALPAHLGVPRGMLQDVLVLEPTPGALDTLRARGAELAAVLVDPSLDGAGSADFLRGLRRVCLDAGAALVVDETHTGFRVHPGGAQGLHGVQADLAVYGGVPGTGLAFGIVAGLASYLDAADGGEWSLDDGSFPLAPTTRVHGLAGESPLALAAARAALLHLQAGGPALLDRLHGRAAALAETLNGVFAGAPLHATSSGPDLRIHLPAESRAVAGELFPIHLREQGVHARDGLRLHLCTAHTDADLAQIARAVEAAVAALHADGLLGGAPPSARPEIRDLPLSPAQRDLWLLSQFSDEASCSCNEPMLLRLRGSFDHQAMQAAVQGLVARHEALRTVFTVDGDLQRVHPRAVLDLPLEDLSADGPGSAETRLARALEEAVRTPFDLTRLPILRGRVHRMGQDDHVVALVFHHLLTDGWSNGLLLGDLRALYEAERRGAPAALAAPGRAGGAGEPAGDADGAALMEFWAERLAGHQPGLDLPTDRPRPPVQDYAGGLERQTLDAELHRRLLRLAEANGATLFGVLLAAFQLFLHRVARQDDVVVGAIFAGQHAQGTADTVGCWVDVLPVRSRLSGAPSFAGHLAGARAELMDAMEHRGASLGDLAALLDAPRDPTRPPLVSAVLNMHSASEDRLHFAGAEAEVLCVNHGGAKFELDLTAVDTGGGLRLDWEYRSGLFDRGTILRWMKSFRALLHSAADTPGRPVHELEMLDDGGRDELRRAFQGPRREYPVHRTLGRLFEEQAARTPGRTAVVHDGESLTYAELDRRAGLLARRLAADGVGAGRFVGILDERGIDFVTGVVAVLKAGGAYVPVDPAYPADRVRHMLRDSGVAHLLTRRPLAGAFADALAESSALRHVLCFDEPAAWDADAAPLHGRAGHPRDPAYMLYTSGSTGLPKGAVIRHDGAVNHVFAQAELLELDEGLAFLQSAPASSDISVWQMLAPLVLGGRTVVVDPDTVSDPARLLSVLRGEGITLAELVPAVLRALLEHVAGLTAGERALPALRWMMATGEEVPVDLVNAWLAAYAAVGLTNAYGPTEASDDVTQLPVRSPLPRDGRSLSIGRPLPNVDCHVVDPTLRLVPVGVPGELCVAGIAVGDGYRGRPGRTAASFVPNPFAHAPGETLYRTGDLTRWRADGTLEFLGRIDGQVKVRGFRIELGEVEAALRAHRAVRDCAAVVREGAAGRQLAAFLVPAAGEALAAAELRGWLRERLPEHMVPAALVPLDALPLTPAGKVDRHALAADPRGGEIAADLYVAPRTPAEATLCGIWAEVLRVDRVGVETDFFALGGHSLLAAMVVSRVRAALGVSLPMRRLFEHTTVARLAAQLEETPARLGPAARPAIGRVERSGRRVQGPADGFLKSVK